MPRSGRPSAAATSHFRSMAGGRAEGSRAYPRASAYHFFPSLVVSHPPAAVNVYRRAAGSGVGWPSLTTLSATTSPMIVRGPAGLSLRTGAADAKVRARSAACMGLGSLLLLALESHEHDPRPLGGLELGRPLDVVLAGREAQGERLTLDLEDPAD